MEKNIQWEGRFIDLAMRGSWEYVTRKNIAGIVGIVPLTDDGKIVLCEQYRPPVDKRVIELPAGLVGDKENERDESFETAARRELLEETGYEAGAIRFLFEGVTSAGVSDEVITFFLATDLKKAGLGGGDESENIIVHEVPVEGLVEWLELQRGAGKLVDLKLYSVLHFCRP